MDLRSNVKHKTIKFLEDNIRGNLDDCEFCNNFADIIQGLYP